METSDDEDKSSEFQNEAAVLVFCFVYLKTYKDWYFFSICLPLNY